MWEDIHLYCGVWFQSYCKLFFITYNISLLIIINNIDLTVWNIEDGKQTNTEYYSTIDCMWHYFIIMEERLK